MLARNVTFGLLPRGPHRRARLSRRAESPDARLAPVLVIPRAELLAEARALLESAAARWGRLVSLLLMAAIWLVAAGVARPIHALARGGRRGRARTTSTFSCRGAEARRGRRADRSAATHAQARCSGTSSSGPKPGGAGADGARARDRGQHSAVDAAAARRRCRAAGAIAGGGGPAAGEASRRRSVRLLRDGAMATLFFAIGDVSDKGIPAALFMARMSALLRVLGAAGEPPDRLLAEINARLVDGNDACMFVTVGCGVLDVRTGTDSLRERRPRAAAAAGARREPSGSCTRRTAAALGIDAAGDYRLSEGFIAPGDTLVLYHRRRHRSRGAGRLALRARARERALARRLRRRAGRAGADDRGHRRSASGFHATDDLTVMAVGLRPPDGHRSPSRTRACTGCIEPAAFVRRASGRRSTGCTPSSPPATSLRDRIDDVELIAEELLTNVVRAAGARSGGSTSALDCALTPSEIVLTFRDDGPRSIRLAHGTPARSTPTSPIARSAASAFSSSGRLADACRYSRIDGRNVLEIRLRRQLRTESRYPMSLKIAEHSNPHDARPDRTDSTPTRPPSSTRC